MKVSDYTKDPLILAAAAYLESRGKTFGGEFGLLNAVSVASEELCRNGLLTYFFPRECMLHKLRDQHCLACAIAAQQADEYRRHNAREHGWLVDEPAGDVPMEVER